MDVGGGTGTMAKAFAKEFNGLECTVFDLPHVVDGLQSEGNVKFVSGDMFEAVPPADAIFLKVTFINLFIYLFWFVQIFKKYPFDTKHLILLLKSPI